MKMSAIKLKIISQSKHSICLFMFLLIVETRSKITRGTTIGTIVSDSGIPMKLDGVQWSKGIINYYLDNLSYDSFIAQKVRMAMNTIESASCVRFKPILLKPAGNMTWIHFTNPQGERKCVHRPFYNRSGEIILTLGLDCLKERDILRTLLYAVGFKDEVTHPHRDQYVRVLWNNIQPEYRQLYQIQSGSEISLPLVEYDPLSIMHFHDRAFSMNGQPTLMPLVPGLLINPSNDLSQLDKMKLRLLFDRECNKRKVGDMIDTCKMVLTKPKDAGVKDRKSTKPELVEEEENQEEEQEEKQEENQDENEDEKQEENQEDNQQENEPGPDLNDDEKETTKIYKKQRDAYDSGGYHRFLGLKNSGFRSFRHFG